MAVDNTKNIAAAVALALLVTVGGANAQPPKAPETPQSYGKGTTLVVSDARQRAGQLQEKVANVNVLQQYQEIIDMMTPEVLEKITNAEDAEHARRILIAYFNEIND